MELVKNIFFNTDKLTPFIKVKISYAGKFFEDGSQKVFIHYGFGSSWENSNNIEMIKSNVGFQAEIELTNSDTFNNSKNYIFTIEKADLSLIPIEENNSLISSKKLRKFYLWKKKFKINIYKAITFLPRLINGKYKRKLNPN